MQMVKTIRKIIQLTVLVSALWVGIGSLYGWSVSSVEKYCPMGGLATSYSLVSHQQLTCATSEFNIMLLVSLLLLTLIARKAFCSWMCPVGTVSEWVGLLGSKIRVGRKTRHGMITPPPSVDRPLRWLRLPIVVLVLASTFALAELVFRPFCPYYVMFSMHGHEVEMWSYGLLGAILVATVVVPMAWCRYLCPLGGALWPLSAASRLRIRRTEASCTNCNLCEAACPHSLPISSRKAVTSGECTLCMECTYACSRQNALTLHIGQRAVKPAVIPLLLVGAVTLGVVGGSLFAIPSYSQDYESGSVTEQDLRQTTFEIEGVRCVDTARRAAGQLEGVPGVVRFTAFASHRRAEITFDASKTDVEMLREAIEGPVYDEASGKFYFHVFRVVRIDGQDVD